MIDPSIIGKRVSERRRKLGKSREGLAYEAGVSTNAVRSLELAERSATLRVLGAVADALGVSVESLVRGGR